MSNRQTGSGSGCSVGLCRGCLAAVGSACGGLGLDRGLKLSNFTVTTSRASEPKASGSTLFLVSKFS